VPKVGSVEAFKVALGKVLAEKRKAENVLLDEIEGDMQQKERFLSEQIETLQEMNNNLNALIEHKAVISIASQIINGVQKEEEDKKERELEENKQEIQMQNLDSSSKQPVQTSINSVTKSNDKLGD
jgi:hypothetical protein